ncbi:hypothetical protein BDN67DRAFT_75618 [Paxillus ammoniavirescens]|nr:hypothetical protein BDN67DRAFT_75618 [Paxillus ammoniavirescens]
MEATRIVILLTAISSSVSTRASRQRLSELPADFLVDHLVLASLRQTRCRMKTVVPFVVHWLRVTWEHSLFLRQSFLWLFYPLGLCFQDQSDSPRCSV